MELEDFVKNFSKMFDEDVPDQITADTEFKALNEWSSLMALNLISLFDEMYGARLKSDDIRKSETVRDLFELIPDKNK